MLDGAGGGGSERADLAEHLAQVHDGHGAGAYCGAQEGAGAHGRQLVRVACTGHIYQEEGNAAFSQALHRIATVKAPGRRPDISQRGKRAPYLE